MNKPTTIAILALAALSLGSVGIAQSDDGLDWANLDARLVLLQSSHDEMQAEIDAFEAEVVDTNESIVSKLDEHTDILECFEFEAVKYQSVTLTNGRTARVMVPIERKFADQGPSVRWVAQIKRSCLAKASS